MDPYLLGLEFQDQESHTPGIPSFACYLLTLLQAHSEAKPLAFITHLLASSPSGKLSFLDPLEGLGSQRLQPGKEGKNTDIFCMSAAKAIHPPPVQPLPPPPPAPPLPSDSMKLTNFKN